MSEKKKKDEEVADDESTTTKKRGEKLYTAEDMGTFMAMQSAGPGYWTSPKLRYPYYAQTTAKERKKAAGTALGISLAGAGAQRAIQASAMFDPGLDYARRQLAEAEATQKRPLKGMSPEKADAIRASARAGVQTEIAETKSDLGAHMASSQQAPSVQDILAVRETGQDAQVSAAIEAEAIIAKQDLAILEANQRKADQAKLRADEMQSVLFEKRDEQRGYNVKLIGDVAKVAAQYAADAPAASETPVVDQLWNKGVSPDEIGKLHKAAKESGFYPGSQAYRNYMMQDYEGTISKAPVGQVKADTTAGVVGVPVPGRQKAPVVVREDVMADVRAQEAETKLMPRISAEDAATRLRGSGPPLDPAAAAAVKKAQPVEGASFYEYSADPEAVAVTKQDERFNTPEKIRKNIDTSDGIFTGESLRSARAIVAAGGLSPDEYEVVNKPSARDGTNNYSVIRKGKRTQGMIPVPNMGAAPPAQATQPRAEPWTLGGITYRFYPQDRTIRYEDPKSKRTIIVNPMNPELQNTKMAAEWKRLMATKPSPWTGGTTPPPE